MFRCWNRYREGKNGIVTSLVASHCLFMFVQEVWSLNKNNHTHRFISNISASRSCKSHQHFFEDCITDKTSSFIGTLPAGEHSFPFQFVIPGECGTNFDDLSNVILPFQGHNISSRNGLLIELLYQRPRWRQWRQHAGVISSDNSELFLACVFTKCSALKPFVLDTKQTHAHLWYRWFVKDHYTSYM